MKALIHRKSAQCFRLSGKIKQEAYIMHIEIKEDEQTMTYTVLVNGEVLLECLAEDEVSDLTIGELQEMAMKHMEVSK